MTTANEKLKKIPPPGKGEVGVTSSSSGKNSLGQYLFGLRLVV